MSNAKLVTIYTRGISSPSGKGGYGTVLRCGDHRRELTGSAPDSSNNRMDILAALEALRALRFPSRVIVYSNNTYVTDAISKGWAQRWRANGWRNSEGQPTQHAELWKELLRLCTVHEVAFEYRRFDSNESEYARCHELAHLGALGEATEAGQDLVLISAELIEAGKSKRGGWSKLQLACLGVGWPPASGWKDASVGRLIRRAEQERFLQLRSDREETGDDPGLLEFCWENV